LTPTEFAVFQKFLVDSCGILLGENKQYLARSRLSGLLRGSLYASLGELVAALRAGTVAAEFKARVIDAMTTNETFWFREPAHFEELKATLLPAWMAGKDGNVRIWSAACSTGQEPYSISLCVEEWLRERPAAAAKPVQIIGTDISGSALAEARTAAYGALPLSRGLEPALRERHFLAEGERWRLKPEVAARVRFQAFNLLSPYGPLGRFDAIFCRNVLIYFPEAIKRDILARLAGALNPGGCLFLGSAEGLPPGIDAYEAVRGARCRYYRARPAG
jgi:chemotaxis protein methyltransferase CheR